MKVKLLVSTAGSTVAYNTGDQINVHDATAARRIDHNIGKLIASEAAEERVQNNFFLQASGFKRTPRIKNEHLSHPQGSVTQAMSFRCIKPLRYSA